MELKNTDGYKWEIDGKRVTRGEYLLAKKLTVSNKFEEYSYRKNGSLVTITEIEE